jgi:large subunit ribosomal protein L23
MEKFFKKKLYSSSLFQGLKAKIQNKINLRRVYTFLVDKKLNKLEIKFLLEELFEVKLKSIRTQNLPIKSKRVKNKLIRKPSFKKVIITLKENNKINY